MKFNCEKCQARYQVEDEKVVGRSLRIRCRRCGNEIVLRPPVALHSSSGGQASLGGHPPSSSPDTVVASSPRQKPPAAAPTGLPPSAPRRLDMPPAAAPPTSAKPALSADQGWFIGVQGSPTGPLSQTQLQSLLADGTVDPSSLVWREGFSEWRPLQQVQELAGLLAVSTAAVPPAARPFGETPRLRLGSSPAQPPKIQALKVKPNAPQRPTKPTAPFAAMPLHSQPPAAANEGSSSKVAPVVAATVDEPLASPSKAPRSRQNSQSLHNYPSDPPTMVTSRNVLEEGLALHRAELPAADAFAATTLQAGQTWPTVPPVPSIAPPPQPVPLAVAVPAVGGTFVRRLLLVAAASFGVAMATLVGAKWIQVGSSDGSSDNTLLPQPKPRQPTAMARQAVPAAALPNGALPNGALPNGALPNGEPAAAPVSPATAAPSSPPAAAAAGKTPPPTAKAGRVAAKAAEGKPAVAAPTSDLAKRERDMLARMAREESGGMGEIDLPQESAKAARPQGEGLSPSQLAVVVQENRPGLARCYTLAARNMGTGKNAASIRMDIDVGIGISGSVTQVGIRSSDADADSLLACLKQQIKRWRFPPASAASQVSFPLVFQPGA